MAKLVDAHGLGPCGETLVGSIPLFGTENLYKKTGSSYNWQFMSKKSQDPKIQTQKRYSFERKADNAIVLSVIVPWLELEAIKEKKIEELVKAVEIPGFRKGNAPKKVAQEKLSKEQIREEILKKVLSEEYVKGIKELNIAPIVNPRIHIEVFEDGTDLKFTAETCEEPKIELKNYKEEVKKVTAKGRIVVPGKEEKKVGLDEILNAILMTAEIIIPKILIEQETNRLLSQLLDELKKLGVSLDQYLLSRGKTAEQLRAEYDERAEKDLKLEFLLRKVADEEKITVEQKDVEDALNSIKDEKQKQEIAKNPYLLASVIRQQKTLDFISKI